MIGKIHFKENFMGILIQMEKVLEKNGVAYYHLITCDFGGAEFYVGIDKSDKKIYCYLTKDFSDPIRIINCEDLDERIGNLPGVNTGILSRVIKQAFKVFKLNEYPQYLDYAA